MIEIDNAQKKVAETLYKNAQVHAAQSDGLLVAVEPDFAKFPEQALYTESCDPETTHTSRNNPDIAAADKAATLSDERYAQIVFSNDEATAAALDGLSNCLRGEKNVTILSGHREFNDIVQQIIYISNRLTATKVPHRRGIIASKNIDFLRLDPTKLEIDSDIITHVLEKFNIPVDENGLVKMTSYLGLGLDAVYKTIPNTPQFTSLYANQETKKLVADHNSRAIIHGLIKDRTNDRLPPIVVGIAAAGTTTKFLDLVAFKNLPEEVQASFELSQEELDSPIIEVTGEIDERITGLFRHSLPFVSVLRLDSSPPTITMRQPTDKYEAIQELYSLEQNTSPYPSIVNFGGVLPVRRTVELTEIN